MSSSSSSPVSLYQLALNVEQVPSSLQLSPRTFRGVLQSVLNFLSQRQISASIWLKIPHRSSWQELINQSIYQSGLAHVVYRVEREKYYQQKMGTAMTAEPGGSPTPSSSAQPAIAGWAHDLAQDQYETIADPFFDDEFSLIGDSGMISVTTDQQAQEIVVPLIDPNHLNQEYFLMVVSESFSGLFLAHRPRSVATGERRSRLLALCSFEAEVLQQALGGLYQVLETGQKRYPQDRNLTAASTHWQEQVKICGAPQTNTMSLSYLITQQIAQQERMVQQIERYRQQEQETENLHTVHETLTRTLEAKDDFLNRIGQELKPPVTNMKTALTLLNSPSIGDAQRQRYMDMLHQACDRQNTMIQGILDLLQVEQATQDSHPLKLHDVIPGVVSTYQPLAIEKGILLAYRVPDDLPAISCPQAWLRQILINLLHNSIKFTDSGGRIWVLVSQEGDDIMLEVQDSGVGISSTDLPRIYDAFYRGKHVPTQESEGAGLGLTVVQQLLIRCGGSIAVNSQLAQGTSFKIRLPIQ
ncbi:MAG: ATP-binding protein [Thainema sp.]